MMKAEVKREHRALALKTRFPSGNYGPLDLKWVESGEGNDHPLPARFAQALADLEATVEARVRRELTEDAWAVGVLDAHVIRENGNGWRHMRFAADSLWHITTWGRDYHYREIGRGAPSQAAARIAAARALTPSTSLPETAGEKEDSNG